MPGITYETEQERKEAALRNQKKLTGRWREEIDTLKAELAERESMLCAVLTVLEPMCNIHRLMERVVPTESGVNGQKIVAWWKQHQRQDVERRKRETQELRERALAKLSPEERVLLGLPDEVA